MVLNMKRITTMLIVLCIITETIPAVTVGAKKTHLQLCNRKD